MALAIVDEALQKDYASGVVGVRGAPDRALKADVQHRGQLVRIRPAESALAVREVLTERPDGGWLVVVTDRDDHDLGAGILSHFVWQRLRSPDPWEAVRHRFSASGIDPALTQVRESRELAAGLLAAAPPSGWPAAPAGVLTRRHALAAVAAAHLDLERDGIDALSVLRWTMRPGSVAAVATLREVAGDRLCDETLVWLADQAGSASECVAALLRQGEIGEVVPMGIVSSLLVSPNLGSSDLDHQAQMAMVRLESRWGTARPSSRSIHALGAATTALLADLVHDRRWADSVDRVLGRADEIVVQIQAEALAGFSDLLPRGMRRRVHRVAECLQRVPSADATSQVWTDVEEAWNTVQSHALSASSARELAPFSAAVRLTRWLSTDTRTPVDLVDAVRSHMADGAWVDAAVNDALTGADDERLAAGLAGVAGAAQERRRGEERAFAQQLAAATLTLESVGRLSAGDGGSTVWTIENLLPDVVMPMAKVAPVLMLVMDGMSAATATEIVDDAIARHGWFEAALPETEGDARAAALAALPTLTSVSRASLLAGRLTTGEQGNERRDHDALTRSSGKIRASLFHKKDVDTRTPGWAISDDVGRAISDRDLPLVTVVLNTIDDALDHAAKVEPARAVPIPFPQEAYVASGLAVLLVLVALFEVRKHEPARLAETIDAVDVTADDIDAMKEFLKDLQAKQQTDEAKAATQEFNQLIEDLAAKRLDRTEAFRRMEALENKLLEGSEADKKALEAALQKIGEEMKKAELTKPAGEALEQKNLVDAEKALKDLAKKLREQGGKVDKAQLEKMREALKAAA